MIVNWVIGLRVKTLDDFERFFFGRLCCFVRRDMLTDVHRSGEASLVRALSVCARRAHQLSGCFGEGDDVIEHGRLLGGGIEGASFDII